MKILFILPRAREKVARGYELICDQYTTELERLGHQVMSIAPQQSKVSRFVKIKGIIKKIYSGCLSIDVLRFCDSIYEQEITSLLAKNSFDIIVYMTLRSTIFVKLDNSYLRTSHQCLFSIDASPGNIFQGNVSFLFGILGFYERLTQGLYEKRVMLGLNSLFLISNRDVKNYQKKFFGNKVHRLQYASNLSSNVVGGGVPVYDIGFIGNLSYQPNQRMLEHFIFDIFPFIKLDCRVLVAGANPTEKTRALCKLHGFDLVENFLSVEKTISKTKIVICPSRDESGVQTKILDAFKLRKPVVCYPEANLGIGAEHGQHLMICSSQEEFATSLEFLLSNEDFAHYLGENAFNFSEKHFNLTVGAIDLLKVWK